MAIGTYRGKVRYGSKAAFGARISNVRFVPIADIDLHADASRIGRDYWMICASTATQSPVFTRPGK